MNEPLLSVCLITYNHVKFIKEAIDGVLMQKVNFPWELIIADDFSTDGTREIILEYKEKYPDFIKLILQEKNVGAARNWIDLITTPTSKYIAYFEGDDYWTDPQKLQKQVDFLEANPDYVICYHDAMIVNESGGIIKNSKLPNEFKRDFSSDELIKGSWILSVSMCFRNVLKDYPDEIFQVNNGDIFFISLVGNFGKGKYVSEITPAAYRKHSSSIWSSVDETGQIFQNGVTRAWLSRYYRRIGVNKYSDYLKVAAINHFATVLTRISSSEHPHENIVNQIFTQFTDLINGDTENRLREYLGRTNDLIRSDSKKDEIARSLHGGISCQPSGRFADNKDFIKNTPCDINISVCIPTYNRAAMLSEAVQSVLKQNYSNYEIIIVDDGSTDNTADIVNSFQSEKIRYIQKEHSGAPATRNRCVAESRGEFLLWLDSDDLLLPNALEEYHRTHCKYPDADILYCYFMVQDNNCEKGIARAGEWYKRTETLLGKLVFQPQFSNVGLFVHRSVYSKIGTYNPKFFRAHDYEFFARIGQYGRFTLKLVDRPLVLYRLHDQGHLSGAMSGKDLRYEWKIIDYLLGKNSLQKLFPEQDCNNKEILAEIYYSLAARYLTVLYLEKAIDYLQKSLLLRKHSERNALLISLVKKRTELSEELKALRNISPKSASNKKTIQMIERQLLPLENTEVMDAGAAGNERPIAPEAVITLPGLISIIIPTLNQLDYSKKCVKSIRKHTPEAHEIIFVDNGSTDGTVKWLKSQVKENKNYRLIENKENVGLAKGRNQGIETSQGEFILLLDNHVVVSEGWLTGMLECLNNAPAAGVIGPMTNSAAGLQDAADDTYRSVDYLDKYATRFKEQYRYRRIPCRNLAGFCMLFKRTLVEKVGLLDERFGADYFEDEDFSLRATLEDYRNYIAGDIFIHHSGGKAAQGKRDSLNKKWTLSTASPAGKKLAVLTTTESADTLNQKGLTDQAIAVLINGIKLNPDAKEYYDELIRIFIESKRFSEAWEVFGTMPEAAKNDLKGLECAGYAKEGLGLDDEAAAYADKILAINNQSPAALNLQGVLAFKTGKKEKAQDYFQKAIGADPGYGEAYTNLGVLFWGMDKKDEALQHLQKGFILSPVAPDASSLYYSVVSSLGIFSDAEADFREACRLYPNHKNLAFLYIEILIQQGKFDMAMLKIEDALVLFGLDEGILNAALSVREKSGPLQIGKAPKKNTLSLCMIVKNEETFLAKCLKSVRDIVDEIIVVDTGSTDKTMDIARVFGAKVFEFPWTGDFSAARNHSLAQATGDWILILDADEVISSVDHRRLLKTIDRGNKRPVAFDIITRNYIRKSGIAGWVGNDGSYPAEETGIGWHPSNKVRLFRQNSLVRFENPVHELLEAALGKAGIPIEKCTVPIHHYGRLDDNKILAKGRDYYELGRKKLEERGGDYVSLRELAVQATEIGKFEEAIDLWQQVLALRPDNAEALFNMGYDYIQVEKYQEALQASKRSVEIAPGTNDALLNYALCEMLLGDALKTTALLEEHAFDGNKNPTLLAILGSAYLINGDNDKGLAIFKKLIEKQLNPISYWNNLLERLTASGRMEYAHRLINAVIAGNIANTKALQLDMTPVLNKIAGQLHARGKNDEALLILNTAIENKISNQETISLLSVLQK